MQNNIADFKLGQTLKGTNDAGTLINTAVPGRVVEFPVTEDVAAALNMGKRTIGARIKAIALRNTSAGTFAAKDLVVVDETANWSGLVNATGASAADDRMVAVVDFMLTSTVADDDIFWGIIGGPATVKTTATDWAGGELLKSATGEAATASIGIDHGPSIIGTVVENTGAGATEANVIMHPDWASLV